MRLAPLFVFLLATVAAHASGPGGAPLMVTDKRGEYPRPSTSSSATARGGKTSLSFMLDKYDVLTFRTMNGVKIMLNEIPI